MFPAGNAPSLYSVEWAVFQAMAAQPATLGLDGLVRNYFAISGREGGLNGEGRSTHTRRWNGVAVITLDMYFDRRLLG